VLHKVVNMFLSLIGGFAFGVGVLFVVSALTGSLDIGYLMLIAGLAAMIFLALTLKQRVSLGGAIVGYVMVIVAVSLQGSLPGATRSNVARVRTEMRVMSEIIEWYRNDHGLYPLACDVAGRMVPTAENGVSVGYLPRIPFPPSPWSEWIHPEDPFVKVKQGVPSDGNYRYATNGSSCWILSSLGPDRKETVRIEDFCDPNKANGDLKKFLSQYGGNAIQYDATNGTTSDGDIMRSASWNQEENTVNE